MLFSRRINLTRHGPVLYKCHYMIFRSCDYSKYFVGPQTLRIIVIPLHVLKYPHCAIICGQTGCGKTEFVLDLLEGVYRGVFEHIVIFCPTIQWNRAYKNREWIGDVRKPKNKNVIIVNPVINGEEKLQELLRMFFNKYAGSPTLYIIDD